MIEIIETGMGTHTVIRTVASLQAAKSIVRDWGYAHMADDPDYPNCADAYLNDGRTIAMQPVGFSK